MVGWMVWYLGRRRRGEAADDGRWKDEGGEGNGDDDDDDDDGERAREEQKRGLGPVT